MKIKVDYKNAFPKQEERALAFDLYINGFNGCETVKYSRELSGQSETLKKLCATSVAFKTPIISAFDTNNYGTQKKSVGVFENGKLLGISDASTVIDSTDYLPSLGGKLYSLSVGKIGVAIQDDLFSFTLFKALAICGAEFIVCLTDFSRKEINSVLIRAYAFLLGVPIVLTFKDGAFISNVDGNLQNERLDSIHEVLPSFEFVLKTTKIRLNKH